MKVGAGFVCARRGGTTASFDVLNKFFTICGMPVATSQYWNNIHGGAAGEAVQDRAAEPVEEAVPDGEILCRAGADAGAGAGRQQLVHGRVQRFRRHPVPRRERAKRNRVLERPVLDPGRDGPVVHGHVHGHGRHERDVLGHLREGRRFV